MLRDERAERRAEMERRRQGIEEADPWYGHTSTDVTHSTTTPVPSHSSPHGAVPSFDRSATDVTSQFHARPSSPLHGDFYYGRTETDVTRHLQVPVPKFVNPYGQSIKRKSGRITPERAHSFEGRAFDVMHPLGTHRPFPLSDLYFHGVAMFGAPRRRSRSSSPSRTPRGRNGSRSQSRSPSPCDALGPPEGRRSRSHSPRSSPRRRSRSPVHPGALVVPRRTSRSPPPSAFTSPRRRSRSPPPTAMPSTPLLEGPRSRSSSPRRRRSLSRSQSPRRDGRAKSRSPSPALWDSYGHLPQDHQIPLRYLRCRKRCQLCPPCEECAVLLSQDRRSSRSSGSKVQFSDAASSSQCPYHGPSMCPFHVGLPCYGVRSWSPVRGSRVP
ncbi:hypothetical protein Mapa_016799 [Marchantia paleacea]|nr:hypothetical protein Mapa_016799 [Marchantia paleacea]